LKPEVIDKYGLFNGVFIHRSNKTRIETKTGDFSKYGIEGFLYIDPIKQGLKLTILR